MSLIFQHRWYFFSIGLVTLSCIRVRLLFFYGGSVSFSSVKRRRENLKIPEEQKYYVKIKTKKFKKESLPAYIESRALSL